MSHPQQLQFLPEPADESKNRSFPNGLHIYGLEPILGSSDHITTRKRDELLGTHDKLTKKRYVINKNFFDTDHKYLDIKKFSESSSNIHRKYKNVIVEEAEMCLQRENRIFLGTNEILYETRSAGANDVKIIQPFLCSMNEGDITASESINMDSLLLPLAMTENTENSAGVTLTRPEYYIHPAIKDLPQYMNRNGECIVQGLTIGRKGYGSVYFQEPVDITNMNFDEIVVFHHRKLIIYADETKKPPIGEGLNRQAEVTLDKIFPRENGTNKYITDADQIIESNFVDSLISVTQKHDGRFVVYRPKTGSWVFKVEHFSRYAFTDSDEEECAVSLVYTPPEADDKSKMPSEKSHTNVLEEKNLSERTLDEDGDACMRMEDIFQTSSSIQTMKHSLFANLDSVPTKKIESNVVVHEENVPSDVLAFPNVSRLPDLPLVLREKFMRNERCYSDLALFRSNHCKVSWGKDLKFTSSEGNLVHTYQIHDERSDIVMMPDLPKMLRVALEESEFTFDQNNVPTLNIKKGLTYLEKQTGLFNDHVCLQGLTGKEKYSASVWNLCIALWGAGENSHCSRRQYVSDWLTIFTRDMSDEWNTTQRGELSEADAFKTCFTLLSYHKVKDAYDLSVKHKMTQLSLMISQLSANEKFKSWMRKFVEGFVWGQTNVILDDFKKLCLLLAGVPMDGPVVVCDQLDWIRCFGIYLWYVTPSASPVEVALRLYQKAFKEFPHVTRPIPPYCLSEAEATDSDIVYHILALYSDSTYQLCHVLHPGTHTDDLMDYRLSWFMLQLFLSLKVGLIGKAEKQYLHTTFAAQLERTGHWKWAIFTLLYLEDNVLKKNLIMRIMDGNLTTTECEKELVNIFNIPQSWIHEVKATKAKASGNHYEYFQNCVYMNDWHEAHNVLVDYITPELFISGQYEYLRKILDQMAPVADALVNWNVRAGLFKDFIDLHHILRRGNGEEVGNIRKILGSVLTRSSGFPTNNDKQCLCVAELSKQCVLLFKLLRQTVDDYTFQTNFLDLLKNLVIPSDIKNYEIYSCIAKIKDDYAHRKT